MMKRAVGELENEPVAEPRPASSSSPIRSLDRILTLDLGTSCGWTLRDGKIQMGGTWDLSGRRHEGGGMRYLRFQRHLREIGPVGFVAYEEVRSHTQFHKGHKPVFAVDAAHIYGGLLSILTAWCEEQQPPIPYEGVPVGTIKKHATGKGNADKIAMVKAAREKLKVEPTSDDEADARWLMDYVVKREAV